MELTVGGRQKNQSIDERSSDAAAWQAARLDYKADATAALHNGGSEKYGDYKTLITSTIAEVRELFL